MDKQVYLGLKKVFEQNLEAVLITVTSVLGSTPRKPGAKMLVFADGTTVGTIGGGCGEAEAKREALNVLTKYDSKTYSLNMTADIAQEEGMVCGGIMELFMEYIGTHTPVENADLNKDYLAAVESHNHPVLVTVIEAAEESWLGNKLVIKTNGDVTGDLGKKELNNIGFEKGKIGSRKCQPFLICLDFEFNPCESSSPKAAYRLLVEPPTTVVQLLILGAGHIAVPLATMAKIVGYEVTVVDDRPSFANVNRFSTANKVLCADFERALETIDINPQTFVVIITRGHRYDKVCLKKVINHPAAYIGMIGSRKRVKSLLVDLEEEGVAKEALQKLYSPIGLKIGAETPEEIAVSILSELIKVQRGIGE
ncbi:XdhC family protein [Desulfosporosinus nitroreducens]|uniref:XdhC family protein n=1 Tax=Desulfosporosinus nitroreducens TaxID=2018668 RepID=UPI00207CD72A|nr:XdhC/CoxI family protein [Desulfosporosinus nitroreducens]MCO1601849.1 XdhC family protein [Desulfosporosinus nitroreducens]